MCSTAVHDEVALRGSPPLAPARRVARMFSPPAGSHSPQPKKRMALFVSPIFKTNITPTESHLLPPQAPLKSPPVSPAVNSHSSEQVRIIVPKAFSNPPPVSPPRSSPLRRAGAKTSAFSWSGDPGLIVNVSQPVDASPVSVPPAPALVTPTASNADSWQEMGYPDARLALACQRITDQR